MTIRSPVRAVGLAILLLLGVTGCPSGSEQLAPVKGKVTFKGVPLQGGTIVFIPEGARGTHGPLATGEIQADGTFTLKTNDTLGAVVGWHRVTVSWVRSVGPGQWPQSVVPAKYRDPQQSGLACEVQANKPNTIELDLE